MRSIFILSIVALASLTALHAAKRHAFYVSITELAVKNDTLQISLRLFTDDLEMALKERNEQAVFLNDPATAPKNFIYIRDYVNDLFTVSNAAKKDRIEWLGHEFEDDVCWVYGQVALDPEQKLLYVKNEVLMDIHEAQQNIIHFTTPKGIETKLSTKNHTEVRFVLQ